jgi:hypothetical protein
VPRLYGRGFHSCVNGIEKWPLSAIFYVSPRRIGVSYYEIREVPNVDPDEGESGRKARRDRIFLVGSAYQPGVTVASSINQGWQSVTRGVVSCGPSDKPAALG